jgi:hypothetical protein
MRRNPSWLLENNPRADRVLVAFPAVGVCPESGHGSHDMDQDDVSLVTGVTRSPFTNSVCVTLLYCFAFDYPPQAVLSQIERAPNLPGSRSPLMRIL